MRLWLSRSSEVPLREQLQAQIILGIASKDLKAGQRLPSTRELALRYKIHANTVSAVYRELGRRGWVEFRKGSGVYVRQLSSIRIESETELDRLVAVLFTTARKKGFSLRDVQARLRHWLALQPPDHFVVIEPDPELRQILVAEIEEATGIRVIGVDPGDCLDVTVLTGAVPLTLYSNSEKVRAQLPPDTELITLHSRSIPESLKGEKKPPPDAITMIVSRWSEFLRSSRTMLIAAGLHPDTLSFRDARERGWGKGLLSAQLVITDSLTARKLPPGCEVRVFRVVSDSSIAELRSYVQQFLS
jgi:DNA-binding transcriptional regulator YhcF (GntR family)